MELSILKIVLYIFIPFAPLYARIVDFNGTLDHAWTMFFPFNVFPLSIVPVLLMAFGFIKKGNGSKPYDHYMWIPIVIRFLGSFIVGRFVENPLIKTVSVLLLSIFSIMIPNVIRRSSNCKEVKDGSGQNSYTVMSGTQWFKSFVDSVFELGFGELFPIIVTFIPFVGIAFKVIGFIPVIGKFVNDIVWTFGFICGYIIVNMYNQNDMSNLCYPDKLITGNDITRLVLGFFFTILGGIFSFRGGGIGKLAKLGKLAKFAKVVKKNKVGKLAKTIKKMKKLSKKYKNVDMSEYAGNEEPSADIEE